MCLRSIAIRTQSALHGVNHLVNAGGKKQAQCKAKHFQMYLACCGAAIGIFLIAIIALLWRVFRPGTNPALRARVPCASFSG